MKGLDQLALLDSIDRTTRELRILRALVLDRERQLVEAAEKPSRWPDVVPKVGTTVPETGTATHEFAPRPAPICCEEALDDATLADLEREQ